MFVLVLKESKKRYTIKKIAKNRWHYTLWEGKEYRITCRMCQFVILELEKMALWRDGIDIFVAEIFNGVIYLVCVCVCVCVSYQSKHVRDNSRRFTHVSKKKITTAAVGPFIS